jgi:hypothetical protein
MPSGKTVVRFGLSGVLLDGWARPVHLDDAAVEIDRAQSPRLGVTVLARLVGDLSAGEHRAEHAHGAKATPAAGGGGTVAPPPGG